MASGSNEITIYGVMVGAVLPLLGYVIFHWLASTREKESRLAKASNDFRESILKAKSGVPDYKQHWDNNVLTKMPAVLDEIKIAVNIYSYFLSDSHRFNLNEIYKTFQNHVENNIPQALSAANVMYGGGQATPEEAKKQFNELIENLLSYASKT